MMAVDRRGVGKRCAYCRRPMEAATSRSNLAATRDHVIPKSRGGWRTVLACRRCNNIKADMMPDEWAAFMAAHPEWWRNPNFRVGTIRRAGFTLSEAVARANNDPRFATGYYVPLSPSDPQPRSTNEQPGPLSRTGPG